MDALDRELIILLEHNPRITYRAISDELGISVPTAQRRVENLFGSGRIRSIRYRISIDALGGNWAFIHGKARVKVTPEIIKTLGDHGCINRVLQCANDYIACHVDIRQSADIDGIVSFLMSRLDLGDLQIQILPNRLSCCGLVAHRKELMKNTTAGRLDLLTKADKKIIRELCKNGRSTVSSIASITGISPRTVRKRIDFLVMNRLIENESDFYLGISDDLWFAMYVRLHDPSAKDELFEKLACYGDNMFTSGWEFANAPDLVTFDGVVQSLKELHDLVMTINSIEGVGESNHVVVLMSYVFDTWVHRVSRGELPLPRSRSTTGEIIW